MRHDYQNEMQGLMQSSRSFSMLTIGNIVSNILGKAHKSMAVGNTALALSGGIISAATLLSTNEARAADENPQEQPIGEPTPLPSASPTPEPTPNAPVTDDSNTPPAVRHDGESADPASSTTGSTQTTVNNASASTARVNSGSFVPPKTAQKGKRLIVASSPNTRDKQYSTALLKMQQDPLRSAPFAGVDFGGDEFVDCPQQAFSETYLRWSYGNPKKGVTVTFQSQPDSYCDLTGAYEHTFTAEVKRAGSSKYKKVGTPVEYTDGIREVLISYGMDLKYRQKRLSILGVPNLCSDPKYRNAKLRVKAANAFIPNPNQTFTRQPTSSATDTMQGKVYRQTSVAHTICK